MQDRLVINNAERRKDRLHQVLLVGFWLIWTPVTMIVTILVIIDFEIMLILWLVFGYLGVIGIPYVLMNFSRTQILEATPENLVIHGTGIPFAQVIRIPREQHITLSLGRYSPTDDDDESESVLSLNILTATSWWKKRIMIAPGLHHSEKLKVCKELQEFLDAHGFDFEVRNDLDKSG